MAIVSELHRLVIEQHVLVADPALARHLHPMPGVTVGPRVSTPVMAYCLMPDVDVVHIHDDVSGQAGLLLTLTRSVPFVMNVTDRLKRARNPLRRSILHRAQATVEPQDLGPAELVGIYRRAAGGRSELPEDAHCG